MSVKPIVSIIILNYNAAQFIDDCITSILKSDFSSFEIIFVDNNSKDNSLTVVSKYAEKVKILALKHNTGFSVGNNIGASHTSGQYLLFLNPDTRICEKTVRLLVESLEINPKCGIIQPKLLQNYGVIDSTGVFMNKLGIIYSRGSGESDVGQYEHSCDIFYAKGAAFIIRRGLWESLNGFDPLFFIYFEETDLCWRSWSLGYSVRYEPKAIVYHFCGGSLRKVPFLTKYHEAKGRLSILIKHQSPPELLILMPSLLALYFFNIIRQLLSPNKKNAVAIISGAFWCLRNFKTIWLSRLSYNRSKNSSNKLRPLISKT